MALEASIVERLQELRKWQIDQQERLLKQQQEQRELLNIEQERMYEALGLSMKDVIVDESIIDQMSVSKIKQHVDEFRDSRTNEEKNDDESQDTPNITRQTIITSKNNSPIFNECEEQLDVQLNVPDVCLKAFDTDLTISDSSNYQNLPLQFKSQIENDNQEINETPKRFRRNHFEMSVKGIEPLEPDKSLSRSVLIDELPVPSPKKDFKTLLEEKLRDYEAVNARPEPKNQIKRPFLRKGEGLARFRVDSTSNKVKKPVRLRPASRSMNLPNNKSTKVNTKNVVQKSKVNSKDNKGNEVFRRSVDTIPNVAQQKLVLSNVALPKKAVCNSRSLPSTVPSSILPSKSNGLPEQCISNDESSHSDLDTSKLETKMFEMLEEKADNSSFCSTSSAVIAFMQQSTPMKLKNIRRNLPLQKQTMNRSIERTNDNVINEIVHTLKSNQLEESSVMQIRETYAQNDIVMSKWDSGPFTNNNLSQSTTRNTQQNTRKITQPINHKNNQLYRHNNNKTVSANYSEPDDGHSNLSSSSEIESVYEDNCHNGMNNPLDNNCKDTEGITDANVSMHVRFAEFNEYKTIGLTDTSTLSTDSRSIVINNDEENWTDHSDSGESSDSEILPSKEEVINQQRLLNNPSKHINPSVDQYDCNYMNANFMVDNKMTIASECNDNTENSDCNSVDQSTDDENSIFNDSEGTYYDEDITISGIQETMAKVLSVNNSEIDTAPIDKTKLSTQSKLSETNDTIFKSDLLKNRLLELEREIDIFRKENAALVLQRQTIQDEHRQLQREFKEKEANLERERIQMNMKFQEEKKRLAREKSALENRLRDAREKSIQTKHERQEIQMLNEQLDELREDIAEKESRWQAAQARQRSQTRVLQMENSKLKSEIEKFQSTKRVHGKLKRPSVISNTKAIHQINKQLDSKRGRHVSIPDEELETAKIIHKKTFNPLVSSNPTNDNPLSNIDTDKAIAYNSLPAKKQMVKPTEESISKKRHLYETLIKDASIDYHERNYEKSPIILDNNNDKLNTSLSNYEMKKDIDLRARPTSVENEFTAQRLTDSGNQYQNELPHSGGNSEQCNTVKINDEVVEQVASTRSNTHLESQQSTRGSYQQFIREIINPRNDANQLSNSNCNGAINARNSPDMKHQYEQLNYSSDKMKSRSDQIQTHSSPCLINKQNENNDRPIENESAQVKEIKINYGNERMKLICPSDSDLTPRKEHQDPLPRPPDDMTPRPEQIQVSQICDSPNPKKINSLSASSTNINIREVKHSDGHTEYWYPNGNVKRIYPDRKITKMIYYNGDVRETLSDGCIKYFYAATKTWHTTYPDGFEILEFPDGQQERRTKDGVVEVSFPDGSVRLMQPDGIEKWALPDGTIAETFPNGEKILSLPNGQREIHTSDHKRREYPDGTVKFVYPDGTQETRYSNGRIRIKDKDGNLVMDSHQA